MFTAFLKGSLNNTSRLKGFLICLFTVLPTFAAAQPGRISIELSTAN